MLIFLQNQGSIDWKFLLQFDAQLRVFVEYVMNSITETSFKHFKQPNLLFLIEISKKFEVSLCRSIILSFCSISCWTMVSPRTLEKELNERKRLKNIWKKASGSFVGENFKFVSKLILKLFDALNHLEKNLSEDISSFCSLILSFLVDLLSQLVTRRYLKVLVEDHNVLPICQKSRLMETDSLFLQMVQMLKFYLNFNIDEFSGISYSDDEILSQQSSKVRELQKIAFIDYRDKLEELVLASSSIIGIKSSLIQMLKPLTDTELEALGDKVCLRTKNLDESHFSRSILENIVASKYERTQNISMIIQSLPTYPSENEIFQYPSKSLVYALPKVNLQYLTFFDFIWRNIILLRNEESFKIRNDVSEAVSRMSPVYTLSKETEFTGWSAMALKIDSSAVQNVGRPSVGHSEPSKVIGEIEYSISSCTGPLKREWDSLKPFDVVFLLKIKASQLTNNKYDESIPFNDHYGIQMVRGAQIELIRDENGNQVNLKVNKKPAGVKRTMRLVFDPVQFMQDNFDDYSSFNVLIRRKSEENQFKNVMNTLKDLLKSNVSVPEWLNDVILGYGDPQTVEYKRSKQVNFFDTFLDKEHILECFPDATFKSEPESAPFKISFGNIPKVESYERPIIGPYPDKYRQFNRMRFYPKQIEAIEAAMGMGLSLVVGASCTGKTSSAIQAISNLYHLYPNEKIILITHSTHKLDQIMERLRSLDFEERHLLRLGHKEVEAKNALMEHKIWLLAQVDKLAASLSIHGDHGYTCETAEYFFMHYILPLWKDYEKQFIDSDQAEEKFPFHVFFSDVSGLFSNDSPSKVAVNCFNYIQKIFDEISGIRPSELLKSETDQEEYLMIKQSRVIVMTSMHAVLNRDKFYKLGLEYQSLFVVNANQLTDIESFVPFVLSKKNDLKRVILIGDENQLGPVIRRQELDSYCNLGQSMLSRLIRLGVSTIRLDNQMNRPSICDLYRWKYPYLGDLPADFADLKGFSHEFQFVNVPDYLEAGETEPVPRFYQNLGEAEYVVAVYQYMRLIGYSSDSIAILTTYNGQKELIKEIIRKRCSWTSLFGLVTVETVDNFHGQQSDFVLLSLVRTKYAGHIKDDRRQILALSRARLGLFVFGRYALFNNCKELQSVMQVFKTKPLELELHDRTVKDVVEMGQLVHDMTQLLKNQ